MELRRNNLEDSERRAWIRLIRTPAVGPRTFRQLLERFGSAEAAIDALPALQRRGRAPVPDIPSADAADDEIAAAHSAGALPVALCEPGYPALLAQIADPPPLIYVRGRTALFERPSVAVVGARNASANGRRFAEEIAAELGAEGFVVVSGLARGIDGAAHRGALPTGTVAAVAGGIDVVYPPEHADLHERIGEDGLLVTEHPPGTVPTAHHFPARNRLISGLSSGVLVIEAALQSGSLITARLALEQGREVFAVPGSPRDPRARGTNDLLRQGAVLTESAADVVEALRHQTVRPALRTERPASPDPIEIEEDSEPDSVHDRVLSLLGPSPTGVDELVRECQMSAASVHTALLELELAGRVERHPGNRVSLIA
jgi:DNA processing protein